MLKNGGAFGAAVFSYPPTAPTLHRGGDKSRYSSRQTGIKRITVKALRRSRTEASDLMTEDVPYALEKH